jgi:hypothetical protein
MSPPKNIINRFGFRCSHDIDCLLVQFNYPVVDNPAERTGIDARLGRHLAESRHQRPVRDRLAE